MKSLQPYPACRSGLPAFAVEQIQPPKSVVQSLVKWRDIQSFWGRRDKGMRNRDIETDICSRRCLVWKLEPINKSTTTKSQGSTLQNSTLHNWFRHSPSCWFGHVPTQLTMDSTEDTAVFNAVDGVHAVNEYKTMQWTMQPSASGVEWWSKVE